MPGHGQDRARGAGDDAVVPQVPGRAARPFLGENPGGQSGRGQRIRPHLAGALIDQTGPGRQRRLAHRIAAQGEHDPFGHAQPGRGRAACVPLARSHSSLAMLAWLDHRRPVVRSNAAANPGASRASCSISFPPRRSNQAITGAAGPPGRVEQHAALGQAGHADAAHPDRPQADSAVRTALPIKSTATSTRRYGSISVRPQPLVRHGVGCSNTGCRAATPTRPRPWTRWCRCRGRRRRWRSRARESWAQLPGAAFDDPGRH